MAKGQQRGNREPKKPKKPKVPAAPPAGVASRVAGKSSVFDPNAGKR